MSVWTPAENPGARPVRSWAFDIGCALLAALASLGAFSFAQPARLAHPPLAVSVVVAVLTALVLLLPGWRHPRPPARLSPGTGPR